MWRKKLRKTTAGILAGLMVFGSLQIMPVEQVHAEENTGITVSGNTVSGSEAVMFSTLSTTTDVTYNFIDLEKIQSYNVNLSVGGGGEITMDYIAQYGESFYKLPEGIDPAKVKKLTLNLTSGNAGDLAIKLYTDSTCTGTSQDPAYGNNTIVPTAEFAAFGIMSLKETASVKISGVTLTVEGEAEITKTYAFADLSEAKNGGVTANTDGAGGAATLSFAGQYQEIFYEIPNEIDSAKVHKVTFNVTSGNGDALAYKFYTEDDFSGSWPSAPNEQVSYCNPAVQIASGFSGMKYFGIMSMNDAAYDAVIESVTFHTTGWGYSEPAQEGGADVAGDKVFTADKLSVDWGTASYELEDGKYKISFAAQYDQVKFTLPETIDLSNCTAVKFTVEEQTVPITLKLFKGSDEIQVEYGKSGATEYTITPTSKETISAVGIMITDENPTDAKVSLVSVTFTMKGSTNLEDNIIQNPNFADTSEEGMAVWKIAEGNSAITAEVSDTAIFGDVKTYGKISRDPATSSTQDCFSQDITAVVEKGAEYQFEFYAMLSDEYADAPEEQRKVEFCPYITAGGSTNYLGTYSSELTGNSSQALTVGEWTKYSGTFTIAYTGELEKVAIRIIEQGTNYGQGDCVKGDYYITGVSMRKIVKIKPEIEQDIPDFKDSITSDLGAGTIAGTAVTASEMTDDTLMELVTKHFNAVTLGNELKLDAMLNYQNNKCPDNGTETVTFNGQQLLVPVLNHSRADKMLDVILDWNNEHPEDAIKVRGHVLVWHSQAPEWFFKENYDIDADFVSKEVMDQRLEWYIKTMLEYYTGSDSKYKDLFYGWDVVNEAINDGTATYRSASESGWAAVYGNQSNEYIIKAFRWANQYAPADLELYYNDYNDCVPSKCEGIVNLLQAVKSAEGTRIDGMGMQAHYNMDSPSIAQFEAAIRAYAAVVGKVQLTELDLKASSAFDGTDATREEEYTKQAYRYKTFYDVIKELNAEEGIEVSGITIWGVVDKYSWLQSTSNVGGGASGNQVQCPLLFDDDYKAKPAFWAFVNPNMLEPATQKITVMQDIGIDYDAAKEYTFGDSSCEVTFLPIWSGSTLKVQVTVKDATVDDADSITLYVDAANSKADSTTPQKVTISRENANAVSGGYQAVLSAEVADPAVAKTIGFDIRVTNGNTMVSFNDLKNTQDTSSKYYAEAIYKPYALVGKGTAVVDGEKESVWTTEGKEIPLTINLGSKVSATVTALWDEDYLYVFAEVKDSDLNNVSVNAHEQDSLEVFIDENNHKSESYEDDDKQYRISYVNAQSFNGKKCLAENVTSVARTTSDGYVIEAAFKWTDITPEEDMEIGLELQINDADSTGVRIGTLSWFDETGMGWSAPAVYGTVKLVGEEEPEPSESPEPGESSEPCTTPAPGSTSGSQSGSSNATSASEPSATPAPTAKPTAKTGVSTQPSEVPSMPSMPEEIKKVAVKLSRLLDRNATTKQKLAAVKEIIDVVKDLAEDGKLEGFAEEAIKYTEDLIAEALDKHLKVEYSGEDTPQVNEAIGALISVDADKEAKLTIEVLGEDKAPAVNEKYINGCALDIKLWAGEETIQPVVPVTLRMQLPKSIDKNKAVKVLHFGEGASEPEELAAKVDGDEVEFTTTSFSTFVVVNVADDEQAAADEKNEPAEEVQEISETGGDAEQAPEAPAEKGGNTTVIIIVVVIVVIIALAVGIVIAMKSKKNDELE